ncbi:unnamed protein product, partial [Musa acuminata subsp. burmannicoides]
EPWPWGRRGLVRIRMAGGLQTGFLGTVEDASSVVEVDRRFLREEAPRLVGPEGIALSSFLRTEREGIYKEVL